MLSRLGKRTLVLVSRRIDVVNRVGLKWRVNSATLLATKPNGEVLQFVVVGKDDGWADKLRGQVFDAVEGLELVPVELHGFVLSRVRPRSEG